MTRPADRNRKAYRRKHAKIASDARPGSSVVLLHDGAVIGFFASEIEAVKSGIAQFGDDPFYVRDVAADEQPAMVASNFPS